MILIRNPGRENGFDVALASTDTTAAGCALIARYDSRWTIETAHQEAKTHGVGEARNRVQRAVERTVPFGFLTQTITITWYPVHGNPETDLNERRRSSPWYRQKRTVSRTPSALSPAARITATISSTVGSVGRVDTGDPLVPWRESLVER